MFTQSKVIYSIIIVIKNNAIDNADTFAIGDFSSSNELNSKKIYDLLVLVCVILYEKQEKLLNSQRNIYQQGDNNKKKINYDMHPQKYN